MMKPEDWIALAGLVATSVIALTSIVMSRRRERQQQLRDDALRIEQQKREDSLREVQRVLAPRIQFDVLARTYDIGADDLVLELVFRMDNKGTVRQEFRSLKIRLRGIAAGEPLEYWKERSPFRLRFPHKIVEDEFVPQSPHADYYYFVEPGVRQDFTYITKVKREHTLLLVHGTFLYGPKVEHTIERIAQVQPST
jgi:hypothetical protein